MRTSLSLGSLMHASGGAKKKGAEFVESAHQ